MSLLGLLTGWNEGARTVIRLFLFTGSIYYSYKAINLPSLYTEKNFYFFVLFFNPFYPIYPLPDFVHGEPRYTIMSFGIWSCLLFGSLVWDNLSDIKAYRKWQKTKEFGHHETAK
jgi:hypothetical protein